MCVSRLCLRNSVLIDLLQGTVLLNANVAFLEIPYVGETPIAGASQLISYLSIVASVGTIVIGLMLIRQNRKSAQREVPEEVVCFILCPLVNDIPDMLFLLGCTSRPDEVAEIRDGTTCSSIQCSLRIAHVGVRVYHIHRMPITDINTAQSFS